MSGPIPFKNAACVNENSFTVCDLFLWNILLLHWFLWSQTAASALGGVQKRLWGSWWYWSEACLLKRADMC